MVNAGCVAAVVTAAVVIASIGVANAAPAPQQQQQPPNTETEPPTKAPFDHFAVIILENTDKKHALANTYLGKTLVSKGRLLNNYIAVAHPSQPNYVAMVSGATTGVFYDFDSTVHRYSLVDQFDGTVVPESVSDTGDATPTTPSRVSWAVYAEDYPGNCYTKTSFNNGLYRRKHVPLISFPSITSNNTRCANIKPLSGFDKDTMSKQTLPGYMMIVPNMDHDGHDTNITVASQWLESFLDPLLINPVFNTTLFLITFDESDAPFYKWPFDRNEVYAVLVGAGVTPGSVDETWYTHYSQMATVQKRWGLGNLGLEDADATPFKLI